MAMLSTQMHDRGDISDQGSSDLLADPPFFGDSPPYVDSESSGAISPSPLPPLLPLSPPLRPTVFYPPEQQVRAKGRQGGGSGCCASGSRRWEPSSSTHLPTYPLNPHSLGVLFRMNNKVAPNGHRVYAAAAASHTEASRKPHRMPQATLTFQAS